MAVVTFGAVLIALRTLSAIRDQVIANKDAAQAAKDSAAAALEEAKAISASERAYVFARVEYDQPFSINVDGTFFARLQAQFINHGKTPAIIISMDAAWHVEKNLPEQLPPNAAADQRLPEGLVIASGNSYLIPVNVRVTPQQMDEIKSGTKTLYCAGFIKYKDILGRERSTGFCWHYLPDLQRFQFRHDSPLNHYD